ncbi:MAG: hypothetical protein PGMFKBFP_00717 [Anaerolineales bacterium]|nr:hypothetical protein [Anaerolineales bacterium]
MNIQNLLVFDKLTKLPMSALPRLKKEVFLFLANLVGQLSLRAEALCQYTVQSSADLSEVVGLSPIADDPSVYKRIIFTRSTVCNSFIRERLRHRVKIT